tara:strand:- start:11521 stop:12264 length:744 start_codon:yes stop_codon:yes gene_type:complete
MLDFTGQTVVVTGSTRGIGKETAKLFLERGASVYITGTSEKPDPEVMDELSAIGNASFLTADFSSEVGIQDFINKLKEFSRIDVLVNNAGINILNPLESITDEEYTKVLSVNLHAPVKISRYLAGFMSNQGYGRIVNVASIWSVITRPKRGAYTISKNAIIGLTQTLGIELASSGVLVNAISPGFTLTELTKTTNTKDQIKDISNNIPIKRLADPKEMGHVILFLSSKENSYMTGQNLVVDGGFTNV